MERSRVAIVQWMGSSASLRRAREESEFVRFLYTRVALGRDIWGLDFWSSRTSWARDLQWVIGKTQMVNQPPQTETTVNRSHRRIPRNSKVGEMELSIPATSQIQTLDDGVVLPCQTTWEMGWGNKMEMAYVSSVFWFGRHHPNETDTNVHRNSIHRNSFSQVPIDTTDPTYTLLTSASMMGDLTSSSYTKPSIPPPPPLKHKLPAYLKPLPPRMTSVDIDYLFAKGALSLPETSVRNALMKAYIEYVHPYMPLVEMHELLAIIDDATGQSGKVSLLLFQSIMFAGTAFVDMEFLRNAGYTNRKAARKAFFQKARVSSWVLSSVLLQI